MQLPRAKAGQARIAATAAPPDVLLDSESPYRSRRLVVEYDAVTTSAYLRAGSGPLAAVWLANHGEAPAAPDLARLRDGHAPEMPASRTRYPRGSPPPDPGALRALWFEEGDGAALFDNAGLLAALPGWSSTARGIPGYSRDVIGQTPFAWSLADAMDGLGPRVHQAAGFWRWRSSPGAWESYQQGVLGHLLHRLGPGARYWDVSGDDQPLAGVSERPPTAWRPFTVLCTVGMGCQRMPVLHRDARLQDRARVELAIATTLPSSAAARIFLWLAQLPWREVCWLGDGTVLPWYHEPATFPLGGGHEAVLLLADPGRLIGPEVPDLSGWTFRGEPVRWLWVIPVTNRQRLLCQQRGSASVVNQMAAQRRSWVAG
jgi:Suppressor of fused protein (SUFU)